MKVLGHVIRRDEAQNMVLTGMMEGKSARGKQRKKYMDFTIRKTITFTRLLRDHDRCHSIVAEVSQDVAPRILGHEFRDSAILVMAMNDLHKIVMIVTIIWTNKTKMLDKHLPISSEKDTNFTSKKMNRTAYFLVRHVDIYALDVFTEFICVRRNKPCG